MGKKILGIVFLSVMAVSCFAGCAGCNEDKKESSDSASITVVEPNLTDLVVDVAERPTAFSIGTYTLEKIEIDDKELDNAAYVTKNEYCLLANEFYGELGLGEHTVKMYFTEGIYEFSVSVGDGLAPMFELPEENVVLRQTSSAFVLPTVDRECIWQAYDTEYVLKDFSGNVIDTWTNPLNERITAELDKGEYLLEIEVSKNNERLDEWKGEILVTDSENLLSKENYTQFSYENATLNVAWNEGIGGVKIDKKTTNSGINSRFDITMEALREYIANGYSHILFRYRTDKAFAHNLSVQLFDYSDGMYTSVGELASIAINDEKGNVGAWQTGMIPLTDAGTADRLIFLIFSQADSVFELKDMYLFKMENLFSERNSTGWKIIQLNTAWSKENGWTLTKLHDGISSNFGWAASSLATFKAAAKTPDTYLSFEYCADEAFVSSQTPTINLYANDGTKLGIKNANLLTSITATKAGEWKQVVCSLSQIAKIEEETGSSVSALMLLLGGNTGSSVSFRNMRVIDGETYYREYYQNIDYFSSERINDFTVVSLDKEWSTEENSVLITQQIDGFSGNHSYVRSELIAEMEKAVESGFTKMTFSVKADEAYLASADAEIRVFAHTNSKTTMTDAYKLTSVTFTQAGQWLEVEIDLSKIDEIIAATGTDITHLTFAFGGDAESKVYLKNLVYKK